MAQNVRNLRAQQKTNKQKQIVTKIIMQEREKAPRAPFKLKQFMDVPSRVTSRPVC